MARQTLVKCPKCGEIKIPNGNEWFRHCKGNWMIADHIYQDVRPDFNKKESEKDVRLSNNSKKPDRKRPQERVEPSSTSEDSIDTRRSDDLSQATQGVIMSNKGMNKPEVFQLKTNSETAILPENTPQSLNPVYQVEQIKCGNCNEIFQYSQGNYPSNCPKCGVSWE